MYFDPDTWRVWRDVQAFRDIRTKQELTLSASYRRAVDKVIADSDAVMARVKRQLVESERLIKESQQRASKFLDSNTRWG